MSPAETSAGTSAATGPAPGKEAPATGGAPARRTSAGRTDAELRDALVGLTGRDAMSWPHTTGLGQMMMWVSAYTRGLLSAEGPNDSGPSGRITH